MYELSTADKIWNRACYGGGESPSAGDKALASLLLFHGPTMNGGVLDAIQCLSSEQLVEAKNGYRFFGFIAITKLISSAEDAVRQEQDLEALETTTNEQYWAVIPDDGVLVEGFKCHQRMNPLEYSPVV